MLCRQGEAVNPEGGVHVRECLLKRLYTTGPSKPTIHTLVLDLAPPVCTPNPLLWLFLVIHSPFAVVTNIHQSQAVKLGILKYSS